MNYDEAIDYLLNEVPMFQKMGKSAYKEGLGNTLVLDNFFHSPHQNFKSIHIGGTNGKGSCSHTIAAVLQAEGYKVGLYTSPHLVDFCERIKINGQPIDKCYVGKFVSEHKQLFDEIKPSFFELTTALAFKYFSDEKVDFAVVEVGMGGRLDCTNVLTPILSVITNISLDHTQFLGDTIEKIAAEKAGIIKPETPVVIGEKDTRTASLFTQTAQEKHAPLFFAEDTPIIEKVAKRVDGTFDYHTQEFGVVHSELAGNYQLKNARTILCALHTLRSLDYAISNQSIRTGFANVCESTGFWGRWQKLHDKPLTICDVGHNVGGITYVVEQLAELPCETLHIVFGMVSDKDIDAVLAKLPQTAHYIFTQANIERALDAEVLRLKALSFGLHGETVEHVGEAYEKAMRAARDNDAIFIGGSCFVVADLLKHIGSK